MGLGENKRLQRLSPEQHCAVRTIDSIALFPDELCRRSRNINIGTAKRRGHSCHDATATRDGDSGRHTRAIGLPMTRSPHRYRWIERGLYALDVRSVMSPALNDAGSSDLLKELERDLGA
jgi:hypothetical protein